MPLFGKHRKNTDSTNHHGHHDNFDRDARHDGDLARDGNLDQQQQFGQTGTGAPGQQIDQREYGRSGAGPAPAVDSVGRPGEPNIPPASHINQNANGSPSTGNRLAGKAERAVGSLVGSQALKEKGFQKEQEASAFKAQSAEIAQAERLEKEALMRRERAVAHGAHPDNRHLGGMQNANTLSDVTGPGGNGQYGSGPGGY